MRFSRRMKSSYEILTRAVLCFGTASRISEHELNKRKCFYTWKLTSIAKSELSSTQRWPIWRRHCAARARSCEARMSPR